MMLDSGIDRGLIDLLERGSEVAQHHAIAVLKAFYEMGGLRGRFQAGQLNLLPWDARLSLERFVLSDRSTAILKAMQDLIPIIEKAGNPRIREMILRSPLLVQIMNNQVVDVQYSAYMALRQMLFCSGRKTLLKQILKPDQVETLLAHALSAGSVKTRELSMLLILDLVKMGTKSCVERMFDLQVAEKLVSLEKSGGVFSGVLVNFLKGLDKSKVLSAAERKVMRQKVVWKVNTSMKGYDNESSIIAAVEAYVSGGSEASSSSSSSSSSRP
ncbi:unnamed protein product [Spirodela intermedia]|uniref:Uncharacterized protein n=2 Tax=Spirodela intermedia TaxID=51605 RepID=A0A7I8JNK6_SPIIN|nr:unnamed protein product [Spirodela intermedia]CAA6671748.1 unnamed protein product [Spirodela intermedia]CAA7408866.1 unnamed protein product [Spirodela intermedia]